MERGFLIDISVLLKGGYGVQSGIDLYDVIENERFIFEGVVYNPSKKVREIMAARIGVILNGLPVANNKSAL